MDSTPNEATITHEFPPFFRLYDNGHVERFMTSKIVPPSTDPLTGVQSKDVVISPETGISARLYMPKITTSNTTTQKLPLLIYVHGGGFCIGSAFSLTFHTFLNSLVKEANVVAVSVEYRLAPEHSLPIAYDDSWAAFLWVVSHSKGNGPECWLNNHVDFLRVFLAGESAGATIAHDMVVRAGEDIALMNGVKIVGLALVHPFFGGKEPDKMYQFLCPSSTGFDDPRLYPDLDPRFSRMVCTRVLIFVAEKDWLRDRGRHYYEALKKSGWGGDVEIVETDGEGHAFHLFKPSCEKTVILLQQLASFLNR